MTLLNMMLQATTNLGAFAAPLGAAIAVIGAGLGIGKIGSSAMEAIGRQPEAASDVRMSMIIVAALIEGAALFAIMAKTPGKDSKTVQKANPAGSGNSQETRTPKGSKTAATGKKLSQADAKGITGKVDRKALKKPITTQRLKKKKASAAKIHSKKTNKDLHLNVKAAFLVNMSNGKIYYEQNPDTPIAPASITTEDRYRTSE